MHFAHRTRHSNSHHYLAPTFNTRTRAHLQQESAPATIPGSGSTYVLDSGARRTAGAVVMGMTESDRYTLPDPPYTKQGIYPVWWGHREFAGDGSARAAADAANPWACPKRMVDEMTQTTVDTRDPSSANTRPEAASEAARPAAATSPPPHVANTSTAPPPPQTSATTATPPQPFFTTISLARPRRPPQTPALTGRRTPSPHKPDPTTTTNHAAPRAYSAAISPPRRAAATRPPPTLFHIASRFLNSDILPLLDLTVLEPTDEETETRAGGAPARDPPPSTPSAVA
ncbi:hypothetical protein DFJ77DRAFT_469164 [Powellomyces hirtus]|nr:hypothetical protein DFJ77DRAFT_469164 [Powellomyces hirtus]